jgi:hypothetical protein
MNEIMLIFPARWVPSHNGMECPQIVVRGDALLVWRVAANILWGICPMRELLKRRNIETRKNRSTSVYCSLLVNARNSRNSSRTPPRLLLRNVEANASLLHLVATQQ